MCVAVDAVPASERDGDPLEGRRAPRLDPPDLDSVRTVKGVDRVAPPALDAGASPGDHEPSIRD